LGVGDKCVNVARVVEKAEKDDYVKGGKERGLMLNGEGVPSILIRRRNGSRVCSLWIA
jgi:hypothetical protein